MPSSKIEEGVAVKAVPGKAPTLPELKTALEVISRLHREAGGFRDELGPDDVGISYTFEVHSADGLVRRVSSSQVSPGILGRSQLPTAMGTLQMLFSVILQPVESTLLDLINRKVDHHH